jgi:hypothetical protein
MRLYQRLRVIHDALRVGAITLSRRSGRVIRAYISDIPGRELGSTVGLELVVVQYRYHLLL